MSHDFPKFLTDKISIFELEKLKKKRTMHEHKQKAIEITEMNRLKHETKAFMDQVNKIRLNGMYILEILVHKLN